MLSDHSVTVPLIGICSVLAMPGFPGTIPQLPHLMSRAWAIDIGVMTVAPASGDSIIPGDIEIAD